ncbi:MAG: hypothetical protein BRD23_08255, partial [Halobacteriales archaeon SW_9_67_25]
MQGVASMHADDSRAGVFVPASLLRTAFKGRCGMDAPKAGWSAHSSLIPGGLERARLLCRDVPSSPSSGPVYGGPYIGSVLALMQYHVLQSSGAKVLRTRFLPGLLVRFAHSLRPGPPRYRVVTVRRWSPSSRCGRQSDRDGPETAAFYTQRHRTRDMSDGQGPPENPYVEDPET